MRSVVVLGIDRIPGDAIAAVGKRLFESFRVGVEVQPSVDRAVMKTGKQSVDRLLICLGTGNIRSADLQGFWFQYRLHSITLPTVDLSKLDEKVEKIGRFQAKKKIRCWLKNFDELRIFSLIYGIELLNGDED